MNLHMHMWSTNKLFLTQIYKIFFYVPNYFDTKYLTYVNFLALNVYRSIPSLKDNFSFLRCIKQSFKIFDAHSYVPSMLPTISQILRAKKKTKQKKIVIIQKITGGFVYLCQYIREMLVIGKFLK